jgi:hypothetical protein
MNTSQECWFDHERLEVYREAIAFTATRDYDKGKSVD